ncbi:CSEP0294 putative effector protein [Blumeria hordei DH14]|uniref:CSEP0294 putative effector protein n=1 Tax=Blumeria graminis f. sp. hordei (strain DH14) TaxID=546991 RepID=N1J511_BLUG1|nr:CSEP0294 putative effector protein [Blumeria hordei DH14]
MQISIFFLTLMIVGMIAMPLKKHGVISPNNRIMGDSNFKTIDKMTSVNNIKIFESDIDSSNFMWQISQLKEDKVFLNGKNAVIKNKLPTTNRILTVTKSTESLSELPVIPIAVASELESPVKHAKRALHQTPSGFRLDGRRSYPYYNQKSICT